MILPHIKPEQWTAGVAPSIPITSPHEWCWGPSGYRGCEVDLYGVDGQGEYPPCFP